MMRSIERTLLLWVVGTLLLGSVLVALTAYVATLDEMQEVLDADLKHVAEGVAHYHLNNAAAVDGGPVLVMRQDHPEGEDDIATFAWDGDHRLVYASDARIAMPYTDKPGLAHLRIDGVGWVVYAVVQDGGVVLAGQRRLARRQMAGESAAKILPPMLMLALIVAGLLVLSLRRGLQPLDEAARDVANRSVRSLDAIDTSAVPLEVLPMVRAINGLMAKLDTAFALQRRFFSDAAHELRTPVAALRLQVHLLERSEDEDKRAAATAALKQGIARTQRLIEQLLSVARTDPDTGTAVLQALELGDLIREVIEPYASKAEAWDIDLGAELEGPVAVMGDREQLLVLLRNLLDNALFHTPAGGVVDVGAALDQGMPTLFVRDTGPGIPEEDLPRVFSRFFKVKGKAATPSGAPDAKTDEGREDRENNGAGLGLAIVKAIADRHGAVIKLSKGKDGLGLAVYLQFPAPRPTEILRTR